MLGMLFVERLFHCCRKHEGFLFSLEQCCFHVLGVWILGERLAGLAGSERSVTASGLMFVGFSFPSVSWHCDSVELPEWGIAPRPASLPGSCVLLRGTLLFRKLSRWIREFLHLSRVLLGNGSYLAVLPEQNWENPRHFCAVRADGFNQQVSDFLLEGFICEPFPLADQSL